jgi:hypothetical protein
VSSPTWATLALARRVQGAAAMKRLTLVLGALLSLSACVLDLEDEPELGSITHELGTRVYYNFAGERRYVRVNDREVKLFMTAAAAKAGNPKLGFYNDNHFTDSCGPTAAINVFNWYGIVTLEGKACYWHSEFGLPPIWTCQDRLNPINVGVKMKTNSWYAGPLGKLPGTSTSNFRKVFKEYVERYMPADYDYQYRYQEGDGLHQYNLLWATLAQGNPVVINYKTGATKGHFAVIVGIEKAGDPNSIADDRIYLANPRKEDLSGAISYGKFRELWRRDYHDFGTLAFFGERRFTRVNLWDATAPPPPAPGSGISTSPSGSTHTK